MQLLIHSYLAFSVILVLSSVVCVLLDILFERRAREKRAKKDLGSAEGKGKSSEDSERDRAD